MSAVNRIIDGLVPLEQIQSPWDYQRWFLRTPTLREIREAPPKQTWYRDNFDRFVKPYPDQGNRGLCVGWSNKLDAQINEYWETGGELISLSAEDLYWKARKYDGIPDWLGEGSNNLGAMKARQKLGVCLEETYPTSQDRAISSPGIQKPHDEYLLESCHHVIENYYQIPLDPGSWVTSIAGIISDPQWDGPKPIVAAYKVTQTMINYSMEHDGLMPEDPGTDLRGGHRDRKSVV